MSERVTRVVIVDESLTLLPAVAMVLANPGSRLQISVAPRDAAQSADIVVARAAAELDATLGELAAMRRLVRSPKVLLIGSNMGQDYREAAAVEGAFGFLDQSADAELIIKALGCMARGELWLDRRTTGRVLDRLARGVVRKRRGMGNAAL